MVRNSPLISPPISPYLALPHLQLTSQQTHQNTYSPPAGIPKEHMVPHRRNSDSCEARPGLIESTHLAPLNEGLMSPSSSPTQLGESPPSGIDPEHVRMTKGPRRNSCEARPGLIQSTHLAPLNEGRMASERA